MIRFFIGKVTKAEKDHTIYFSISDFADVGDKLTATPLTRLSRFPMQGDEVLILQPSSDVEVFLYSLMPNDQNVTMTFGKANLTIKATKYPDEKGSGGEYEITLDTDTKSKFTLSNDQVKVDTDKTHLVMGKKESVKIYIDGGSKIEMSKTKTVINNHLEIKK